VTPGESIEQVVLEASPWRSQEVPDQIEVEMTLSQVLAGEEREGMIRLPRFEPAGCGWRLKHVHEGDRGQMVGIASKPVLEANCCVPQTVRSRVRDHRSVRQTEFEVRSQTELEQVVDVLMR